ncbi:hypothetical protein D0868_04583 [Hortaea werneckii]|uniref:NADP-dependent oxidoreductase domain-containing protein n=1 Tax=Hortaea werneckii TaxID=91943 RepID=A0A3M6Z1C5_HORWE|nr:hypothetical protein D0868_04583 [Hortaea werneckii]
MALPDHFRLNTGAQIPGVGLGYTVCRHSLLFALVETLIDPRQGNESEVGQGIRDSGVPREDIFLTSKLWNTHHPNVQEGLQQSLDALGVDYLDLYNESHPLLPTNPDGSRAVDRSWDMSKTWLQMEEVYKTGKARAIGVANWSVPYLEALSKSWNVVPAVNQVELHPFLPQHELKRWCKEKGILLEAYSPLGSSDPAIQALATRYSVQPATILISYHVNQGVVVLPKSVTETRITQNRKVIKFEKEDLVMLDSLASQEGKAKRLNTPLWGFDLGFDDWYGPVARQ